MMRQLIIISLLVLSAACSSKTAVPRDSQSEYGLITAKEEVDLDQLQKNSKTKTSVYASVSSGGGVSIGIGFLIGLFSSDRSEENPTQYKVSLSDGGEITIFHDSPYFEVDDCVKITRHDDSDETPPSMERSKQGC